MNDSFEAKKRKRKTDERDDISDFEPTSKKRKKSDKDDVSSEKIEQEKFNARYQEDIINDEAFDWDSVKIDKDKRTVKIWLRDKYHDTKLARGLCRSLYIKWNKSEEFQAAIVCPPETPFEYTDFGPVVKLEFKQDVYDNTEVAKTIKKIFQSKSVSKLKLKPKSKMEKKEKNSDEKSQIAQDIINKEVFNPTLNDVKKNIVKLYLTDKYLEKHSAKDVAQCMQNKWRHEKNNKYGLKQRLKSIKCEESGCVTLTYHDINITPNKENADSDISDAFQEKPLFPRNNIGKKLKPIIEGKVFSSLSLNFNRRKATFSLNKDSPFSAYEAFRVLDPKIKTFNQHAGEFYITKIEYLAETKEVGIIYADDCPNEMKTLDNFIALLKDPESIYNKIREIKKTPAYQKQISLDTPMTMFSGSTTKTSPKRDTPMPILEQTPESNQNIANTSSSTSRTALELLEEHVTEMMENGELDLNKDFDDLGFTF